MSLLEVKDLTVRFALESPLQARLAGHRRQVVAAVDDISFSVERGGSLGIVGESGCGKSTLARVIVGLVAPSAGEVRLGDVEVGARRDRATRRRIQMVFQDPGSSLNPARTVGRTLAELLRVHSMVPSGEVERRCEELLDLVQLPASVLKVRPQRLSGGQRQRVAIARALALEPEILIADEAVAALDVSVQASILNLLADLRASLGLTLIFISHDLAVVRHISERVIVMYLGRVVESAPTARLFADPRHPYTRALIAAAPQLGLIRAPALSGEPTSPLDLPPGCRFEPRCPISEDVCRQVEPTLVEFSGRSVACHVAQRLDAATDPKTSAS